MKKRGDSICGAKPLAQDYVVIERIPDPEMLTDASSIVRLPSGRLLCAVPVFVGRTPDESTKKLTVIESYIKATIERLGTKTLRIFRSPDNGKSWEQCCDPLEFRAGRLLTHGGKVYFLGVGPERKGFQISCSDDEGDSWSPPVILFEGLFYCVAASVAFKGERLYWALGAPNDKGYFNLAGSRSIAIAGDLSKDPMDRAAWRRSDYFTYPGTPKGLSRKIHDYQDHFLEPNVVNVKGKIRVILRVRIDNHTTPSMAVFCDVTDNGKKLDYRFTQFHPFPGGQNQFHIIYDEASELFWMTSNLPTNAQDEQFAEELERRGFAGTPGNERRFLMLFYSVDAMNWFQACCIAMWPSPLQAFNYASMLIDGKDLLVVSRTSKNGRNQHDNDLVTFHRLQKFRALALNLYPEY